MPQLAIIAFVILGYTLVAVRLDRLSISGPMVLVTVGILLGPADLGAISAPADSEPIRVLAELTLALLLFTDASTIGLREAEGVAWLPGRLMAIGLPITIAAGALIGSLLFSDLGIGFALLLGSILAPTDAALSLPLILDLGIPVRIRRAISIESGLNDGIASPFVTLFLAVSVAEETTGTQPWLIEAGLEITIAVIVAVVVGGLGGRLTVIARDRGWASPASISLAVVALAILGYTGASAVGGNGFVAAFVAGIVFRTVTASAEPSVEFAEDIGLAASYIVWLLFGVGLAGPVLLAGLDPFVLVYAVLSLTVVRMGPVALSLLGARLRTDTIALIGWFGPRGLASIVFLLVAYDELGPEHLATTTLVRVATWTILLSVFAHGLTAGPVGALYKRRIARAPAGAWELGEAEEPRIRRRDLLARQPTGSARPPTDSTGPPAAVDR